MEEGKQYVVVRTKSMIRKVNAKEIDYITQDARKVVIVCSDRRYEFYEKIANVVDGLGDNFVDVLKYSYVNFDRVIAMENQYIEFIDGNSLYVGITNFAAARQKFSAYLFL